MPKYSVIVPVYNRPNEVSELLSTLVNQTFRDFEVVIVEDGSTLKSDAVIAEYQSRLSITYFIKENEGQGFARNYGFARAKGDYFIVFDSDCLIPPDYFQIVDTYLGSHAVDAFGGPDAAHPSFTTVQKAINQTMTSFFTTGGIRGGASHVGKYHPRSFNMGFSREVYEKTKGYIIPFMGEDMEFSTRLLKVGFESVLIPEAYVFHKRRTSPVKFFKQLMYFGRARINLSRFHAGQVGMVHLFPLAFTLGLVGSFSLPIFFSDSLGFTGLIGYLFYLSIVFSESLMVNKSLTVAALTPVMTLLQMTGYATGLLYEGTRKLMGIDPNTRYIDLY